MSSGFLTIPLGELLASRRRRGGLRLSSSLLLGEERDDLGRTSGGSRLRRVCPAREAERRAEHLGLAEGGRSGRGGEGGHWRSGPESEIAPDQEENCIVL